jgi:ATP-dependent 26S proteasome regulatory subunit
MRRFQAILFFGMPNTDQRLKLWKNIQNSVVFDQDVDLMELATQHELSGGAINNIVQNAWISSIKKKSENIEKVDLLSAIRREYLKEGKTVIN